ncbi:MAG: DnaJ domain-containing protein [gamma proteobacterium symbiont of Taylorina sp.]|nr:DnaJ domain-containing protein [gamma proteobacterium symbiont of Taylorina sp.]
MKNPLKRAIIEVLRNAHSPIKEYELHEILGGNAFEQFVVGCSQDLQLFRQHFIVMNALYELHHELLPQNIFLHISALDISIRQVPIGSRYSNNKELISEFYTNEGFNRLSDYYLNWDNFNKTNDKDVEKLLNNFWQNYLIYNEHDDSLACLKLTAPCTWLEIKQKYRELCQKYHPDKGGDKLYFLQIRQAYDNLKPLYS